MPSGSDGRSHRGARPAGGTRHVYLRARSACCCPRQSSQGAQRIKDLRTPRAHTRRQQTYEIWSKPFLKFRTYYFFYTAFLYGFKRNVDEFIRAKQIVASFVVVSLSLRLPWCCPYLTSTTRVTSLSSTLISVGSPPRECPQPPPSMVELGSESEASRAMYVSCKNPESEMKLNFARFPPWPRFPTQTCLRIYIKLRLTKKIPQHFAPPQCRKHA